jgi:CTP:molybdopterin cytidylyltransferase MocA
VTGPGDSSSSRLTTQELLATLIPGTDLVRVVERVCRARLSHIIVSAAAEAAWAANDPAGWARVREWLAAQHAQIVRIPPGGTERDTST